MIDEIKKVLNCRADIIYQTEKFQIYCKQKPDDGKKYLKYRKDLSDFFDTFSENEVMILQSIMYIGRDSITGSLTKYINIFDMLNDYFDTLHFKLNKKIDKDIEINQMVGKGLKIADYFGEGFKIVNL